MALLPRFLPASYSRLLVLLLLLSSLATPAWADIVTIDASHNGKQVQLTVGDRLVVRLPTGSPQYGWRLAQAYPGMLTLVRSVIVPGTRSGVPGAPATHELQFQAIGRGGTDLTLISALPGTGYSPVGSYFHVYLTIDQPGVAKNVNLTEYDNHGRVTVNKGDQLQIRLSTTVGSKYRWEAIPVADNVVQLVTRQEEPAPKRRKKLKPGSPEEITFNYQALNPGQTTIRFLYRDATNNEAPPARDFVLDVQVP